MNLNRMIVVLVGLVLGLFVATAGSFAAKGGKGGGKPPPSPTACAGADTFPGFSYEVEARRKTPAEIHLASTDGCRSELVAVVPDLRNGASMRMTKDRSRGVLLWTEDVDNTEHYTVQRQDFTVKGNGDLTLVGSPVTLLPLSGEEAPAQDYLYYFSMDIWGDETHDSLYLAITRLHLINATPSTADEAIEELLIYNLNDMDDEREIYLTAQNAGEWDCPSPSDAPFPQFVPTCYRPQEIRFNPSGTRLYIKDNINDLQGQRWNAALRMDIGRVDEMGDKKALADWTFNTPELVYAGSGDQTANGFLARPASDPYELPSQEFIAIQHTDRTGKNTLRTGDLLDADTCVDKYVIYADGTNNSPGNFLWGECLDTGKFFAAFNHGGGDSWQSPEALLTSTLGNRGFYDIYRRYVTGGSAGTEELLIEHARGADNGF